MKALLCRFFGHKLSYDPFTTFLYETTSIGTPLWRCRRCGLRNEWGAA